MPQRIIGVIRILPPSITLVCWTGVILQNIPNTCLSYYQTYFLYPIFFSVYPWLYLFKRLIHTQCWPCDAHYPLSVPKNAQWKNRFFSGNFYFAVFYAPQMRLTYGKGRKNLKPNWEVESILWQKQKTSFSSCLINCVGITWAARAIPIFIPPILTVLPRWVCAFHGPIFNLRFVDLLGWAHIREDMCILTGQVGMAFH